MKKKNTAETTSFVKNCFQRIRNVMSNCFILKEKERVDTYFSKQSTLEF